MPAPTNEEAQFILQRYLGLYSAFTTKTDPAGPLLLAHYTSVQVVEQILKNEEIWFSNPLYMNDLDEMRSGISLGSQVFPTFAEKAGGSRDRALRLIEPFNHYVAHLVNETALDTYVFCLSKQPIGDTDGKLSMWREYGSKGNGAALVFNTQKLRYQPHSPIIIAKVEYTGYDERKSHLERQFEEWVRITQSLKLADNSLYLAAYAAFDFVKSFALIHKHKGFAEEEEWRAIYVPERDPVGYLKPSLDYFVGLRGVEPKLKFRFGSTKQPTAGMVGDPLGSNRLIEILEFIMLGPTVSYPLAKSAFVRMLERIGKDQLGNRVFPSTIPLRPQT